MSNITRLAKEAKILLKSGNYSLIEEKLNEIIELDKPKKRDRKSKLDLMLEKIGYTREQMQKFWDDALEVNWKIQAIANSGKSWQDLNETQLLDLVNLKEKTLQQLAEKDARNKAEKEAEEIKKREQEYYEEHFEEIILKKLQNHEKLTDKEYSSLVYEYEVWSQYVDKLRFQMIKKVVFEVLDHYFMLEFQEDMSDMGINYYPNYPVEGSFDLSTKKFTKFI